MAIAATNVLISTAPGGPVRIRKGEEIPAELLDLVGPHCIADGPVEDEEPVETQRLVATPTAAEDLAGPTVGGVREWVGSDMGRAQLALDYELGAHGKGRAGVVNPLKRALDTGRE